MNRLYRWFARHCVCWWADHELPAWLRSSAKNSDELVDCEREFDAFEALLKSDAAAWAEAESSRDTCSSRSPSSNPISNKLSRGWQLVTPAVLVAAASVVLLLALRSKKPSAPTAREVTFKPQVEDVQQATDELQALTSVLAVSLDGIDSSLNGLSSATQGSFDLADGKTIRKAIKQPLESFSRGYGKAIAFIAKHQADAEID